MEETPKKNHQSADAAGAGAGVEEIIGAVNNIAAPETPAKRPWTDARSGLGGSSSAQAAFIAGASTDIGAKQANEDMTIMNASCGPLGSLFAVLDGHRGPHAAHYAKENLANNITAAIPATGVALDGGGRLSDDAVRRAVVKGFMTTDKQYVEAARSHGWDDGTTAAVALLSEDPGTGQIRVVVAWAGDSPVILCRANEGHLITTAHTLKDPAEETRVAYAGGNTKDCGRGIRRLLVGRANDSVSGLIMTRTIGDAERQEVNTVATAEPDVEFFRVDRAPPGTGENDRAVVVASDGILDVLTPSEVARVVAMRRGDPQGAAELVVQEALGKGSKDNCTAIVVFFSPKSGDGMAAPPPLRRRGP